MTGAVVGSLIFRFLQNRKEELNLSGLGKEHYETLTNWNRLVSGELSTVSAYLNQGILMQSIGEVYLRIDQAYKDGRIDRQTAEALHFALLGQVEKISGLSKEELPELIAQSVALAEYAREKNLDLRGVKDVDVAEFFYEESLKLAKDKGTYDQVLSQTERRIAYLEHLTAETEKQQLREGVRR